MFAKSIKRIRKLLSSPDLEPLKNPNYVEIQAAILASRARYPTLKHLADAEVRIYSQWGEDGILDFLCDRLGIERPKLLEVGAGNFGECNSRFLVEYRNASATLVDADSSLEKNVKESNLFWQTHLYSTTEWVTSSNINRIINKAIENMRGLDIFSLDLDGNDYWILKDADLGSVKIIVVEYNSIFGSENSVSVPKDDYFDRTKKHFSLLYYGASLKAFVELLKTKGFIFVGTNRVRSNAFFVHEEIVEKLLIEIPRSLIEFTDCKIRESRDEFGQLSHLELERGFDLIKDEMVIDLERDIEVKLRTLSIAPTS